MPRPAQFRPLPLPRRWPLRVRSAVVQVISLARTSLALTQGWASESMNPELRRQAEEDRLRQEILLLREEIRIKDSRVACRSDDRANGPRVLDLLAALRPASSLAVLLVACRGGRSLLPARDGRRGLSRTAVLCRGQEISRGCVPKGGRQASRPHLRPRNSIYAVLPPMRFTTTSNSPAERLDLNHAADGPGDPLAPLRGLSSEVSRESDSVSRSATSLGGGIYRSSI